MASGASRCAGCMRAEALISSSWLHLLRCLALQKLLQAGGSMHTCKTTAMLMVMLVVAPLTSLITEPDAGEEATSTSAS